MNSASSALRGCFAILLLSLLLAGSLFGQGTVPKFLFVANYIDGTGFGFPGSTLDWATY